MHASIAPLPYVHITKREQETEYSKRKTTGIGKRKKQEKTTATISNKGKQNIRWVIRIPSSPHHSGRTYGSAAFQGSYHLHFTCLSVASHLLLEARSHTRRLGALHLKCLLLVPRMVGNSLDHWSFRIRASASQAQAQPVTTTLGASQNCSTPTATQGPEARSAACGPHTLPALRGIQHIIQVQDLATIVMTAAFVVTSWCRYGLECR